MTQVQTELEFDLGTDTIRCGADEVAAALAGLLREMRAAAPFVTPHERQVLRSIMSHDSGALTVGDVFPDFDRNSDALTALRRLRTAQFIRPQDRDRWEAGEHIEVKPFARIVWDRLGEAGVFGDAGESEPEPEPQPDEEIDLALPDVNADDDSPTTPLPQKKLGWDEADVLEFLNDDPPGAKSRAG
jgi:hypothetical protein